MKNVNKKYIIFFLSVTFLIVCFSIVYLKYQIGNPEVKDSTPLFFSTQNISKEIPVVSEVKISQNATVDTITIKIGDHSVLLPVKTNTSLYDILLAGQKAGQIHFTGKNYSSMGFFISSIENLHEGDGKYLIYYVNGVEASVGISSYIPKINDVIEWKISTSI